MSSTISNANSLVNFVKDFTGSTNDAEIKKCIFMAEMKMRNIELPALRTNPYTTIGTADSNGFVPIPADMNRPILFFNQGQQTQNGGYAGPWIVYDRIGDRDMIGQQMIQNLYLNPVNIPQLYRGNFSEVGQVYEFTPALAEGAQINMYYFKAWPELFSPQTSAIVGSGTGTVAKTGSGPWTITITNCTDTDQFSVGDIITATAGTGNLGTGGSTVVSAIVDSTTITATKTGGTTPGNGTITDIIITNPLVQTNVVLQSWSEGYVYGTLCEYYNKRKMPEDAAVWQAKFDLAWNTVTDQNNKGKWSGGHTKLTSVFQPRQQKRFSTK